MPSEHHEKRPELTVLALMRNETDRFLEPVVKAWCEFADEIFILDDASTDASVDVARSLGATVIELAESDPLWGNESPKRERLFTAGVERISEGAYAFILDLDMVPLRDPRPLLTTAPDAIAFPLYDLWARDEQGRLFYRCDALWQAHTNPRIWAFKKPSEPREGWLWSERGLHSGHLPKNFAPERVLLAPPDYALAHLGYLRPELREAKFRAYTSNADLLTSQELEHAVSIMNPAPRLEPLPFTPEYSLT